MTYTGVQDQTIRPRTKRWSDSTWLKAIFAELRRTTSSRAQSEHGWRTFDSKPLDVAGGRATALRQRNDDSKQRRRRSGRRRPAEPPPAGWQGAESHCSLRFHEKYTHSLRDNDPPCRSQPFADSYFTEPRLLFPQPLHFTEARGQDQYVQRTVAHKTGKLRMPYFWRGSCRRQS